MSHEHKPNLNLNQNKRDPYRQYKKANRNGRNYKPAETPLITNNARPTKRSNGALQTDEPPTKKPHYATKVDNSFCNKINNSTNKLNCNPNLSTTKNLANKRLQKLRTNLQNKVLEEKQIDSNSVNSTNRSVNSTNRSVNSTNRSVNSTNRSVNATNCVNSTNSSVNSTNCCVNSTNCSVNSTNCSVNSTNRSVNATNCINSTNRVNSTNTSVNSTNCSVNSTNRSVNSTTSSVTSSRTKFKEYKKTDFSPDNNESLDQQSNYTKDYFTTTTSVKSRLTLYNSPLKFDNPNISSSNLNSLSNSYETPSPIVQNSSKSLNYTPYTSPVRQNKFESKNPAFNFVNNCSKTPPITPNCSEIVNDSMEWAPIDDEAIVKNIHEIRKDFDYSLKTDAENILNNTYCQPLRTLYNNYLYIVVDTNIFLSYLNFLTTITNTTFQDFGKAVVVIPWMVIQELDYMKISNVRESIKTSSRKAVQFINTQLMNKHPQFKGQTVMEASKDLLASNNPDDGILSCCLQLTEHGKSTVLLSNDINLRNKAMMNNIRAFSNNDIINELNEKSEVNNATELRSLQKLRILLSNLLTEIIEREMHAAYGDIWQLMAKVVPPFTAEESLALIDKYWMSVFSFKLQKQCKQKVDDFASFLKKHKHSDLVAMNDFNKFIEYSLSICIYLKNGYPDLKQKVTDCICNIQKAA